MALHQASIRILLVASAAKLHTVLLGEALDLPMAEHGQSGKSGHHGGYAKALVAITKLINRGALIGIAHEVNVTLEDIRIEFNGVLDDRAILCILLIAHHVHEGAVVN